MSQLPNHPNQRQKASLPSIKSFVSPLSRLCLQDNDATDKTTTNKGAQLPISDRNTSKKVMNSNSDSSGSHRDRSRSRSRDRAEKQPHKNRKQRRRNNDQQRKRQISTQKYDSIYYPTYGQVFSQLPTKDVSAQSNRLSSQDFVDVKQSESPVRQQKSGKGRNQKQNGNIDRFYKTKMCPQYANGNCDKGQKCSFAHGNNEIRIVDFASFKTKICYSFLKGECKKRKQECKFAHGKEDMRFPPHVRAEIKDIAQEQNFYPKNHQGSEVNIQKQHQKMDKRHRKHQQRNSKQHSSQKALPSSEKDTKFIPNFNQAYELFANGGNTLSNPQLNSLPYKPYVQHNPYHMNSYYGGSSLFQQVPMNFSEGYGNYYPLFPMYPPSANNSLSFYPTFPYPSAQEANFAFSNYNNFDLNTKKSMSASFGFDANGTSNSIEKRKDKNRFSNDQKSNLDN